MSLQVLLTFKDRQAFNEQYAGGKSLRGFFVPGYPALKPGNLVNLDIVFVNEVISFHATGIVESRVLNSDCQDVGFQVMLQNPERDRTVQLIMEFARGEVTRDLKRRPRRFRVRMPVEVTADEIFAHEFTADVSKGGAFISTNNLLHAGTLLALRLKPPEADPIEINAEVARHQAAPETGIGVNFVIGDPEVQLRINHLIDNLAKQNLPAGGLSHAA